MIKLFSVTIVVFLCLPLTVGASYTLNGKNIEDYFGNMPKSNISLSSGTEADTAIIWFDPSHQKAMNVKWVEITLNFDNLAEKKLQRSDTWQASHIKLNSEKFIDKNGFLGQFNNAYLKIISNQFCFEQTSLMFSEKASIEAKESCSSIIRSLEFIKRPDKKSIFLQGEIDFTKKDGNFTAVGNFPALASFPGFLVAGISELNIIFDRTKF